MTIGEENHRFYGTVLLMLGDTLAAHAIGGFKVGVGFSLRVCRDCMATKEKIQKKVHDIINALFGFIIVMHLFM